MHYIALWGGLILLFFTFSLRYSSSVQQMMRSYPTIDLEFKQLWVNKQLQTLKALKLSCWETKNNCDQRFWNAVISNQTTVSGKLKLLGTREPKKRLLLVSTGYKLGIFWVTCQRDRGLVQFNRWSVREKPINYGDAVFVFVDGNYFTSEFLILERVYFSEIF